MIRSQVRSWAFPLQLFDVNQGVGVGTMEKVANRMRFSEIVEKLSRENGASFVTYAPIDVELTGVSAIEEATAGTISYVDSEKFANCLQTSSVSALILPNNARLQELATHREIPWVAVREPRLAFAQTIRLFYKPYQPEPGIHPTAILDPSVRVGKRASIGAHVVIYGNVTLGDDVCILPNVVIYPDVEIGDRTLLHANCTIHERARIGSNCVIHSGAVVGAEGFGFVPIPDGWYKMEQSGYVVLEDGVEVGCNSSIDRPAVGETRVARNTKIDNLVQIGHGCQVGPNGALAAQVGLAGGVILGKRVILGGQVGVANQVRVGDGVQAGAKAGIQSHVEPGLVVLGVPSLPYWNYLKSSALFARLPEMHKTLREIQKRLGMTSTS